MSDTDRRDWEKRVLIAACDQDGNWWRRLEAAITSGEREWIRDAANGEFPDGRPAAS